MLTSRRFVTQVVGVLMLMSPFVSPLHAQRIGVMAGATFSNIRGEDDIKLDNRTGTFVGVSLQVPVGSSVALQPELLFINKGATFNVASGSLADYRNVRLDYVEIPLLLRYDFARTFVGPHVYAGPTIGFNARCEVSYETIPGSDVAHDPGTADCTDKDFKPKSLDYGLLLGGGVDFNLGGISATGGARYEIGLADIRSDNSQAFRNRVHNGVLAIYLGVGFGKLGR